MSSFRLNSSFNEFYESVASRDHYDSEDTFGKQISGPKYSGLSKVTSFESMGREENHYLEHQFNKKSASSNYLTNLENEPVYSNRKKLPSPKKLQSASTMPSFASALSLNSASTTSMQSSLSGDPANANQKKKKKKKKSSKSKRKKEANDFKVKYKTEVCKFWAESGSCPFGDNCAFAHGKEEVRQKIHIHSNYKTKQCAQFHELGWCIYGVRCQFLHCFRKDSHISPSLNSTSYSEELENVDACFTSEKYCVCMRPNRPRLPAFEKSSEYDIEAITKFSSFVQMKRSEVEEVDEEEEDDEEEENYRMPVTKFINKNMKDSSEELGLTSDEDD